MGFIDWNWDGQKKWIFDGLSSFTSKKRLTFSSKLKWEEQFLSAYKKANMILGMFKEDFR